MPKERMSVAQIAKLINRSVETVRRHIYEGAPCELRVDPKGVRYYAIDSDAYKTWLARYDANKKERQASVTERVERPSIYSARGEPLHITREECLARQKKIIEMIDGQFYIEPWDGMNKTRIITGEEDAYDHTT